LYFIVCGQHPDWGYVDQPPVVPLIAAGMYHLFPGSVVMLRLPSALAHAATVALAAATARRLGGGWYAQFLAALSVLMAGVYLGFGTLAAPDTWQPLAWLFCAYALIRLIRGDDRRWWIALGVAAGIGFLSKYTIAFWLAALGLGMLATRARHLLMRRDPYLAAGLALVIVAPNLLWQAAHGWPFLELARVTVTEKNVALSPLAFMLAEADTLNYVTSPVWIAGLVAFSVWRPFADLRVFAIAFVLVIAAMIAMHAKPYYPVGAYTVLFAGGAVAIEAWIARRAARAVLACAIVIVGLIGAPFALPVLPIERFAAYQQFLGMAPHSLEKNAVGRLPQYYADMFGWSDLAALVGQAFRSLPPEEQSKAVFLGNNYGEAAAIELFDKGQPPAISPHNNFFLWGPRGFDGSVVIRLGGEREQLLKAYDTVEAAGRFENPWAMPYETGLTLWICRGLHPPLDVRWASLKKYG
ncbi:MAG: glycosyltransferase family 39 protein, partial [Alphaproteobacteria bacterium]|nr:glycosyltransferase family 39 protein [Alphaproteobacteria bacterium]